MTNTTFAIGIEKRGKTVGRTGKKGDGTQPVKPTRGAKSRDSRPLGKVKEMSDARIPNLEVTPEASLGRYLREIRDFSLLTAEEEQALARRWRDHGERQAADRLVTSHLRLAAKVAFGYRGYNVPMADLISEGNLGLVRAAERFDPERGFRFSTFAVWWIRAAIQERILHSWSLVKIGTKASEKKLFFNLRRLKSEMDALDNGDLSPDQVQRIAERLAVAERDVIDMNRRMAGPDPSLSTPVGGEDSGEEWQNRLVDESDDQETRLAGRQETAVRLRLLACGLDLLSERERAIIIERRLTDKPATLEVLSEKFGVSRERIRQIEVMAFAKLRKSVWAAAREARAN